MSSHAELDRLQAEALFYRERVALLRAKLYKRGLGTSGRLRQLERELERAEERLRNRRSHTAR